MEVRRDLVNQRVELVESKRPPTLTINARDYASNANLYQNLMF